MKHVEITWTNWSFNNNFNFSSCQFINTLYNYHFCCKYSTQYSNYDWFCFSYSCIQVVFFVILTLIIQNLCLKNWKVNLYWQRNTITKRKQGKGNQKKGMYLQRKIKIHLNHKQLSRSDNFNIYISVLTKVSFWDVWYIKTKYDGHLVVSIPENICCDIIIISSSGPRFHLRWSHHLSFIINCMYINNIIFYLTV